MFSSIDFSSGYTQVPLTLFEGRNFDNVERMELRYEIEPFPGHFPMDGYDFMEIEDLSTSEGSDTEEDYESDDDDA